MRNVSAPRQPGDYQPDHAEWPLTETHTVGWEMRKRDQELYARSKSAVSKRALKPGCLWLRYLRGSPH